MPTYVARISYGKDSLKMLDVIVSRGLPLDRITTSDVWATDTISACLPPVDEFKARMDEVIWKKYRIEVEHLCARNPDGSKKTYEQMFYQVPKRRKEGRKEGRKELRIPYHWISVVSITQKTRALSIGKERSNHFRIRSEGFHGARS